MSSYINLPSALLLISKFHKGTIQIRKIPETTSKGKSITKFQFLLKKDTVVEELGSPIYAVEDSRSKTWMLPREAVNTLIVKVSDDLFTM